MKIFGGGNSPRALQRQIEKAENKEAKESDKARWQESLPEEAFLSQVEAYEQQTLGKVSKPTRKLREKLDKGIKIKREAEAEKRQGGNTGKNKDTGRTTKRSYPDTGKSSRRRE